MNEAPAGVGPEPPRALARALPRRFGDYELEEEIARGAMGVVFKARQLSLDRTVAIKLVLASWMASEDQARRFQTEARASAGLQHPSIVPVHEIGVHEGQPYLCLAYVAGPPLSALIADGPLPPTEAARIARQVAAAIQHAHEHDVLHRDLKPGNILLDQERHPWVTDFGLAKVLADDSQVTATGDSVGTPSYMSPEQAAGEVVGLGPATDVYGLGATLYALLTGRPPFIAPSAVATLRLVQERDPIPLRTLDPSIPRDLETICMRCLAKIPQRRYASAADLERDLGRFLAGAPIEARPVGVLERVTRRVRRHPGASLLAAALLAIAGTSAVVVVRQWRLALDALAAEQAADLGRIESEIQALGTATPQAFAELARRLDFSDAAVMERLEAVARDPASSDGLRFRARLATLAARPDTGLEVVAQAVGLGDDPHEFRLAVESLRGALASADSAHRDALLGALVARIEDESSSPEPRLLSALTLAACAPQHPAWRPMAGRIAERLVTVDPFYLPAFAVLLRPFPRELLEEFGLLFRQGDERRRGAAASLLAACGAHEPAFLADLLPFADDSQHASLTAALAGARGVVQERMRAALSEGPRSGPAHSMSESPPEVAEELWARFLQAHGSLASHFALCLDMPLEVFRATCEDLRPLGYRPSKIRPFHDGRVLAVAAVFARDDKAWEVRWDLADVAQSGTTGEHRIGLVPVDIASYVLEEGHGPLDRDLLLTSEAEPGLRAWTSLPALTASEFYPRADELLEQGFRPTSLQIGRSASGAFSIDTLWHEDEDPPEHQVAVGLGSAELAAYSATELCQVEVDVTRKNDREQVCSGIWTADARLESRLIWEATLEGHVAAAQSLAQAGFVPVAISVLWDADTENGRAASVWQRPFIPAQERIEVARRRARAAATLAGTGALAEVAPLLRSGPDPSLRFALAFGLARLGTSPAELLQELESRAEVDVRFALLLALGQVPRERFGAALLDSWVETVVGLVREDPDPGIHSLCGWILRRLDLGTLAQDLEAPRGAGWSTSSEGHTLAHIDAPVDFVMGAAGWVLERSSSETPHVHRIERPYAIGTAEVSAAQMRVFLHEHPEWDRGLRSGEPAAAMDGLTWFEAVAYCRWLSEVEGVPEEEMCYPPLDGIGPEMILEEGHLERTGYRLPCEAEWEYACRAGARTLYAFGSDARLLPEFANARAPQELDTGGRSARPTALGLPNDFGLFDMHGNVQEWCHDRFTAYRIHGHFHVPTTAEERESLAEYPMRGIRGGWFESPTATLSCASRRRARADNYSRGVGFRIARTARPD